jgi:hypothetical protein
MRPDPPAEAGQQHQRVAGDVARRQQIADVPAYRDDEDDAAQHQHHSQPLARSEGLLQQQDRQQCEGDVLNLYDKGAGARRRVAQGPGEEGVVHGDAEAADQMPARPLDLLEPPPAQAEGDADDEQGLQQPREGQAEGIDRRQQPLHQHGHDAPQGDDPRHAQQAADHGRLCAEPRLCVEPR